MPKGDARMTSQFSASNAALPYRDAGNLRRALYWWRRAAEQGDGDAWVDVGYSLQYGIGVRRNITAARIAYRKAIRSPQITEFVKEEAYYHWALLQADLGGAPRRGRAIELLRVASRDGDYPEAATLLRALEWNSEESPCWCRRGRNRGIRGQAHCGRHKVQRSADRL